MPLGAIPVTTGWTTTGIAYRYGPFVWFAQERRLGSAVGPRPDGTCTIWCGFQHRHVWRFRPARWIAGFLWPDGEEQRKKEDGMTVRAKFRCDIVAYEGQGDGRYQRVGFQAVTADAEENKTWSKWTPSGSLVMTISNPAAFDSFEVGQEYFIDIVPAG